MKYTTKELSDILGVSQSVVWLWINEGIVSSHSNRKGEKVFLKAEEVNGKGKGGRYYIVDANDINDFMMILYYESYFYKWFRK